MTARYAIYFSPADSTDLARFGATVLGRDNNSHGQRQLRTSAPMQPFEDVSRWQSYTEKAAHYGFHATIKAPFELAPDCTAAELLEELSGFCTEQEPIELNALAPQTLQGFTALVMPQQPDALTQLAAEVVRQFEPYRQPLSAVDIERRMAAGLSERQIDNLQQYGYPYIFSDFNFHMTLSNQLPKDEQRYLPWVQSLYQQMVPQTPVLDRLAVFRQVDRDTPFVRIAEFRFQP